MNSEGPVVIIEDDIEDQEIIQEVFTNLCYNNPLLFFKDGQTALDYLNATDVLPFIILSDINMPKLDGFELHNKIKTESKAQIRRIPFVFFTTASSPQSVMNAYDLSVQGFFVKKNTMAEMEQTISVIMKYWKNCALFSTI